jgi:hypothetical protein
VLVLFACLATAVVLQSLGTVLLCAERALVDESVGRERSAEKDEILALLRQQALSFWQPDGWRMVSTGDGLGDALGEGAISELPDGGDWVMSAIARQDPTVSRLTASAWLERGRDGIDLPLAAVVAGAVTATAGRTTAWVESDGGESKGGSEIGSAGRAVVHVVRPMVGPVLGPGVVADILSAVWRLDQGWASVDPDATTTVAPRPGATWLRGRYGGWERLPIGSEGLTPATPMLVVLTGGATLDARNQNDIYGVIVVDDGSVLLDGTTLHGALFVTGTVELGGSGRLIYLPSILRWATDRSLNRVRLIPGTREEGME